MKNPDSQRAREGRALAERGLLNVIGLVFVLAGAAGALTWVFHREKPAPHVGPAKPQARREPFPSAAFAPSAPPSLLPPRAATTERPAMAWERLLAADGSPREDLDALTDLVKGYLHSGLGGRRRTIGFNEDLVPALTDRDALGEGALPKDHPAIRDGRLLDRWGTPWQVHPVAKEVIELRSAGPDRKLYTADDVLPVLTNR